MNLATSTRMMQNSIGHVLTCSTHQLSWWPPMLNLVTYMNINVSNFGFWPVINCQKFDTPPPNIFSSIHFSKSRRQKNDDFKMSQRRWSCGDCMRSKKDLKCVDIVCRIHLPHPSVPTLNLPLGPPWFNFTAVVKFCAEGIPCVLCRLWMHLQAAFLAPSSTSGIRRFQMCDTCTSF